MVADVIPAEIICHDKQDMRLLLLVLAAGRGFLMADIHMSITTDNQNVAEEDYHPPRGGEWLRRLYFPPFILHASLLFVQD